jgi:SAM-dependent methyltransferase
MKKRTKVVKKRVKKTPTEATNKKAVTKLLAENNMGVRYDLGCGANKIPGFIGVDMRPIVNVDIVCDLEKFPWPLPSESASVVSCSHVLEHINPAKVDARVVSLIGLLKEKGLLTEKEITETIGDYDFDSTFIRFMDEVWRILKVGGEFVIRVPYAGTIGYYQDPTHINPLTEATFYYFDPFHVTQLFKIYRPKPWEIKHMFWDTEAIMEVVLVKRREDPSFMVHTNLAGKRLNENSTQFVQP